MTPITRTLPAQTHGRYLIWPGDPEHLLVGFHGYAEAAEAELRRLQSIPESQEWTLVSIQGLHRFYRNKGTEIVASWMTRQDRELAIEDNIVYALRVIETIQRELGTASKIAVSGFSQGVAMAYRTACALPHPVSGVIALAGDIPPELDAAMLGHIPVVVIGRGSRDEWYSEEKLAADEARLGSASVKPVVVRFEGGHEWTPEFGETVSVRLREWRR